MAQQELEVTFRYKADPKHYGTTDAKTMADIDTSSSDLYSAVALVLGVLAGIITGVILGVIACLMMLL
jgi:hypothetical protein